MIWAGVFVGRVKELTRVTEINTKLVQSNSLNLVLISVTHVNSLTRPTKIPALESNSTNAKSMLANLCLGLTSIKRFNWYSEKILTREFPVDDVT